MTPVRKWYSIYIGGGIINTRQRLIFEFLTKHKDWVKGVVLAEMFDVTGRTIRSDIERINIEHDNIILSNTRRGYSVDTSRLSEISHDTPANDVPQTPEERTFYIIKQLLFEDTTLRIYDLQEALFVSEHTIESDIKRIRRLIEPYSGLKLIRSNNVIYFESNEHTKRKLYKDLLHNEIHGNFMNLDRIAAHYDKFDLMVVKRVFLETLDETNFSIRKTALPLIMMHLGIMTERMILGYALDQISDTRVQIEMDTLEYQVAQKFLDKLALSIPIHYNNFEINEVANLFLGYQDSTVLKPVMHLKDKTYNVQEAIEKITDYLRDVFGVDLSEDEDFKAGLHLHLQSLIVRAQNIFFIKNVYLNEVKTMYPLIFEMSVHIASLISELFDIDVTESETGFISLHLGAAYERNLKVEKHKVILVTNSNQNFAKITQMKLENVFSDRIEIVSVLTYFDSREFEKQDVDLIICIGNIVDHHLEIPTIQLSMFINTEDEAVLFSTLNQLDKRRMKLDFAQRITGLVDSNYFFTDVDLKTPEEVIGFLSDKLEEGGIVPTNFKKSVLEREAFASTSFEYAVATPHPLVFESESSKIAVAVLKEPIMWGNYPIQLVLLLSISPEETDIVEVFFNWLSEVITDKSKLQRLISAKTRDDFVYWMMEDL